MFRREEGAGDQADPRYPENMERLGFFINDAHQIRMIGAPEKPFEFFATTDDRHNQVRDEAMHVCARREVNERLHKLGIDPYYFPGFVARKPAGPHIPVFAPQPKFLCERKRIFVFVNDSSQDPQILSYSRLQRDLGVNGGSIVSLAIELVRLNSENDSDEDSDFAPELRNVPSSIRAKNPDLVPGLIVMNTGQSLYSHRRNQAMTWKSWLAQPRQSIISNPVQIHDRENRVKGHRTATEHIRTVFDEVICNRERVDANAEIYLIAVGDAVEHVLEILAGDFDKYGTRIAAMAVIQATVDNAQVKLPSLRALLYQRTRQWKFTDVTSNPLHCIELPEDYSSGALLLDDKKRPENKSLKTSKKKNRWNERRSSIGALSDVTNVVRRLVLRLLPSRKDSVTPTTWEGPTALCPTFAGGSTTGHENVFTDPAVQCAVLKFFGQVISDPEEFYNPDFQVYTQAPQPTPHSPLALDPTVPEIPSDATEVTPEQIQLDAAREDLDRMRAAYDACPDNDEKLTVGRNRLKNKMTVKSNEVVDLEEKLRGFEISKAIEAEEKQEHWQPQIEGPAVSVAGHMIDSELVKAAGLGESVGEASKRVDIKGKGKAEAED